jgi:hypothetical protein
VKELEAGVLELLAGHRHRVGVLDLELDARLRNGQVRRPRRCAEACLRSLGQGPDTEVHAAGDLLAVPVLPVPARRERKAEGLDVELAAPRRVRGDHREARDEENLHAVHGTRRRRSRLEDFGHVLAVIREPEEPA